MSEPTKVNFTKKSGYAAFQHKDYRFFWMARVLGVLAIEMQITALSWQVYQLTGKALDLGLIGLAQFMPFLILFLVCNLDNNFLPKNKPFSTAFSHGFNLDVK